MLKDKDTYASLPVADMARAKKFYSDTLGLPMERETEGGIMYESGATRFFVYPSGFKGGGHTQMSWLVSDIKAEVAELKSKGIRFEEYDVPGVEMVDSVAHVGPRVWTAWFKDPDGNLVGLTQLS